jgi:hypothetical protein
MPVSPIEISQAKTIIEEIPTTGHSPLKTLCVDGNTYIAKSTKGAVEIDYEIISEFLCSQFLNIWGIQTPSIKGITFTPELIQNSNLSNRHRWERNYRDRICFGSRLIQNPVEVTQILQLDKFRGFSRFEDPFQFFRIALFDMWVLNEDRKPSNPNLLLAPHHEGLAFYAMDHAFTFATTSYEDLTPEMMISYNDSILDCTFAAKLAGRKDVQLPDFQAYLRDSVNNCQNCHAEVLNSVESCLGIVIPGKAELEQFLYHPHRVKAIYSDFQAYF